MEYEVDIPELFTKALRMVKRRKALSLVFTSTQSSQNRGTEGFEPPVFGLNGQCVIHYATFPLLTNVVMNYAVSRNVPKDGHIVVSIERPFTGHDETIT